MTSISPGDRATTWVAQPDRATTMAAQSDGGRGTSALSMRRLHVEGEARLGQGCTGWQGTGRVIVRVTLRGPTTARVDGRGGKSQRTKTRIHAELDSGCLIGKRHVFDATR